ncbi:MAG: dipicolinate synthase subunit DpsA [Clostridia bacterium]|nr:dipicolinate synthase subunit DpsA [Clostridia bacterium]
MKNNFAIIGGDLRIIYLAKELAKENIVYSCGFENTKELENVTNINICTDLKSAIQNSSIVISSVPLTKNGTDIYMPFSSEKVKINDLITLLDGKTFIAGAIPSDNSIINNYITNKTNIIDLMNFEELTVLNTIATAEGAISDIILNTNFNLHGSNVLILGFGRVAKVMAKKLKALDAKVTCAARKDADFAWMETLGYNVLNINKLDDSSNDFDIIINTVPHLIMDKEKLKLINSNCFLLDLASKPGGFDQDYIKQNNLNYKWSLAIPGKVAPVSSAKYIKNIVYKILNN